MSGLAAFPFYPSDWMSDPALRMCSNSARGVYIDILCLMFEADERGILSSGGNPWTDDDICRVLDAHPDTLKELCNLGILKTNEAGVYYSPRMALPVSPSIVVPKKEYTKKTNRTWARVGYIYFLLNPNGTIKIGLSVNPKKRIEMIKWKTQQRNLVLLRTVRVKNMLQSEKALHRAARAQRADGEWFDIKEEDIDELLLTAKIEEISEKT